MKMCFMIFFFVVVMVVVLLVLVKEWMIICIGVDLIYLLFELIVIDGSVKGFDIDFGNVLCVKLNVKCVWVLSSFDGLILGLQVCKFDVILLLMVVIEQWCQQIDFIDCLYCNQMWLIVCIGLGLLLDVVKFVGKCVVVEQGMVQEIYVCEKWVVVKVEVVLYLSYDQVYVDFVIGCVDGVLMDVVQGQFGFLVMLCGKGFLFVGGVVYDVKIMGNGDVVGVCKVDIDLCDVLNCVIVQICGDGMYNVIQLKYFDFDMYGN